MGRRARPPHTTSPSPFERTTRMPINTGVTTWGEYLKKKAKVDTKQVDDADTEDKSVKKAATKRGK